MKVDEFFDLLFPGDPVANIPSLSCSDVKISVDGFFQSLPESLLLILKAIDVDEYYPDQLLKVLKSEGVDMNNVINDALSFYFSRSAVVIPLTGRSVPLTTSGIAQY